MFALDKGVFNIPCQHCVSDDDSEYVLGKVTNVTQGPTETSHPQSTVMGSIQLVQQGKKPQLQGLESNPDVICI